MNTLFFAAACAILLAAPVVAAEDDAVLTCVTDGNDPDIDLVCFEPGQFCVAAGNDWYRITPHGFGCVST